MSNENKEQKNGIEKIFNKKSSEYFVTDYLTEETIIDLLNDSLPDDDKKGIDIYVGKLSVTLAYRLKDILHSHVSALYLLKSNEEQRAVKMAFAYEAVRLARLIAFALVDTFEQHISGDRPFDSIPSLSAEDKVFPSL